jgi:serine/threonine protein kinase
MIKDILKRMWHGGYSRHYKRGQKIFTGAFSDIYLATRKHSGEEVALKVLTEDGERMARILDENPTTVWEGELLVSMDHPNVIRGIECGTTGSYRIAMEYAQTPLSRYIGCCNNEEEENKLLRIFYEISSALAYLHRRKLVHRDLAMDNIMLKDDTVKLIDFGMAVPLGCDVAAGRMGTPSYMAPEMIKQREYGPVGDIYSFGIIMYELITGHKPFAGKSREERMARSLNFHPASPRQLGKYCSSKLEDLLMRCISKDPAKRPRDGEEVKAILFLIRRERGLV